MEYELTVIDERLSFPIIEKAQADVHGVTEILKRFTCMKQNQRDIFMRGLSGGKAQEYMGNRNHPEARYTIVATKIPTQEEALLHNIFRDPLAS